MRMIGRVDTGRTSDSCWSLLPSVRRTTAPAACRLTAVRLPTSLLPASPHTHRFVPVLAGSAVGARGAASSALVTPRGNFQVPTRPISCVLIY